MNRAVTILLLCMLLIFTSCSKRSEINPEEQKVYVDFLIKTDEFNEPSEKVEIMLKDYLGKVDDIEVKQKLIEQYLNYRVREYIAHTNQLSTLFEPLELKNYRIVINQENINEGIDLFNEELFEPIVKQGYQIVITSEQLGERYATHVVVHEDYEAQLKVNGKLMNTSVYDYFTLAAENMNKRTFTLNSMDEEQYSWDDIIPTYTVFELNEKLMILKNAHNNLSGSSKGLKARIETLYFEYAYALLLHRWSMPETDYRNKVGELENLNPNSEIVLLLNAYISETSELETSDSDIFQEYLHKFRELVTD